MSVTHLVNFVTKILIIERDISIDGHCVSLVIDSLHWAPHITSSLNRIGIKSTATHSLPHETARRSPIIGRSHAPLQEMRERLGTGEWEIMTMTPQHSFSGTEALSLSIT